jgi:endonuclease/exonuclease/phosphatase family metal-dependent hydrolase
LNRARRLRLATWNLGRVHLPGRWWPPSLDDSRLSDEDLLAAARGIAAMGADAVALQELASSEQLSQILSLLGGDWRGALGAPEGFDRHTAVLARADLVRFQESVTTASGRAAAVSWLAPPDAPDALLALASMHVDAFRPEVRAGQVRELVAWAEARHPSHVVLAGDLNLCLDHRPRHAADRDTRDLLSRGFVDLAPAVGPTALLGGRLDHLLARRPGPRAAHAEARHDLRLPLGDHLPVVATIHI